MNILIKILNHFGLYTEKQHRFAELSYTRFRFEIENLEDAKGRYKVFEYERPHGFGSVVLKRVFTSRHKNIGEVFIPIKTWWYDNEDERDLALNMAEETLEKLDEEV